MVDPQNHAKKYEGGRSYLWLGLSLTNLHGSKPFWYHFGMGAPPILEPILVVGLGCSLGDNRGFDPWPVEKARCRPSRRLPCWLPFKTHTKGTLKKNTDTHTHTDLGSVFPLAFLFYQPERHCRKRDTWPFCSKQLAAATPPACDYQRPCSGLIVALFCNELG